MATVGFDNDAMTVRVSYKSQRLLPALSGTRQARGSAGTDVSDFGREYREYCTSTGARALLRKWYELRTGTKRRFFPSRLSTSTRTVLYLLLSLS